jgi:putative redox protein
MQTATVKWTGGEQFLGVTPSGHAVPIDADRERNTTPGPMDMLLVALATVVIILAKKRQKLDSLEVSVSGERAEDPPRVWTKLDVLFTLRGVLDEKAVKDAVELSETKYCSVNAMLKKTAAVTFRFEINP